MDRKLPTPLCRFHEVDSNDLFDAFESVNGRSGQGIVVDPPGYGPDQLLGWAIQEVSSASSVMDESERQRLCTNAILNSRRALSCLVDWYLERDLATLCKNPPTSSFNKADFLVRRGIIDNLASRVLARAVDTRNSVEHEYTAPTLEKTEDVVELFRLTMVRMRQSSDPANAPWMYGLILGGIGFSDGQWHSSYHGWCEPLVIFSRFEPSPWVGVLVPENDAEAIVHRKALKQIEMDELTALLRLAEEKYGQPCRFTGVGGCQSLNDTLGLSELS